MTSAPPDTITCVECGGIAHLISFLPEDEAPESGIPYIYRCEDCMDRFDMVWEAND